LPAFFFWTETLEGTIRMQIRRIARATLLMGLVVASVLAAAPIQAWLKREAERRAAIPHPLPATADESRAIIAAVLAQRIYEGLPPPPPEEGQPAPEPRAPLDLVVSSTSLCLQVDRVAESVPQCPSIEATDLRSPVFDQIAPRKMRDELLLANASSHPLDLHGIPHVVVVDATKINAQLSHEGFWQSFYTQFPGTAGWAEMALPVLSHDRTHALTLVSHWCGGLCGTGIVFYLSRTPDGWKVDRQLMLWIS
jgi:hypothetical protein